MQFQSPGIRSNRRPQPRTHLAHVLTSQLQRLPDSGGDRVIDRHTTFALQRLGQRGPMQIACNRPQSPLLLASEFRRRPTLSRAQRWRPGAQADGQQGDQGPGIRPNGLRGVSEVQSPRAANRHLQGEAACALRRGSERIHASPHRHGVGSSAMSRTHPSFSKDTIGDTAPRSAGKRPGKFRRMLPPGARNLSVRCSRCRTRSHSDRWHRVSAGN